MWSADRRLLKIEYNRKQQIRRRNKKKNKGTVKSSPSWLVRKSPYREDGERANDPVASGLSLIAISTVHLNDIPSTDRPLSSLVPSLYHTLFSCSVYEHSLAIVLCVQYNYTRTEPAAS